MTVDQQIPPSKTEAPVPAPRLENGRWAGFNHLLMARLLELKREPEVIFWVFVFPILLALGLGIAFRGRPAEVSRVAVGAGPDSGRAMEVFKRSPLHASVHAEELPSVQAFNQLRLGKYDLVVIPQSGGMVYRYD